ncbi:hypothetical protein SAY87_017328 [Trapa incisa]|uniref:Cytochrome b5 heme-binding domain-containing protein n=1 Tax=Trapa incisa TaxID=236973 RepID=A0AAN7LJI4_9MYRT|nr:hypothetical protein SAY87_017328 [Trapa incisa]
MQNRVPIEWKQCCLLGLRWYWKTCESQIRLRRVDPALTEWKIYSRGEVSLHKKRDDCWIIIKNRVYDVTSYVEEHPGGDAILTHAGEDSTEGFYGGKRAQL